MAAEIATTVRGLRRCERNIASPSRLPTSCVSARTAGCVSMRRATPWWFEVCWRDLAISFVLGQWSTRSQPADVRRHSDLAAGNVVARPTVS